MFPLVISMSMQTWSNSGQCSLAWKLYQIYDNKDDGDDGATSFPGSYLL